MAKIKDELTISPTASELALEEPTDTFTFDEHLHVYRLNGARMYGITSVLGVIAKPMLIPWAAGQVVEWIKNNCPKSVIKGTYWYGVTNKHLDEAKVAHRKKKESAGDIGKTVHKLCEDYANEKMNPLVVERIPLEPDMSTEISPEEAQVAIMFGHFVKWVRENNVTFIASEQKIYSKTHWIAGTVDAIITIDGKKYVMDIKTYSGIHDRTPFLQMAGYALMLEEMGHKDIVGSIIVRLGKDGTFDVHKNMNLADEKVGFLAALTLFKTLEAYKK